MISQAMPSSFKQECFQAIHDFDSDTFKIALYTSSATLDATTTAYSATNEISGTGYTAGGETLTTATSGLDGTTAFADFDDAVWTSSSFTARGALIYNSTKANRAVAVLDFGVDKMVGSATFTVTMPLADSSNAIVRFA